MQYPSPAPVAAGAWERPAFEVIPLDCEITAYAPDGDDLLP
jgi:coenzyme PQQ precursor peptide PqqA